MEDDYSNMMMMMMMVVVVVVVMRMQGGNGQVYSSVPAQKAFEKCTVHCIATRSDTDGTCGAH